MSQLLTPEVQAAFFNSLKQLLQDQNQPNQFLLDDESFNQLLKNKKIYNAYHDFAEQIYELMGFQLEQSSVFQHSLLQQILEQGRLALYSFKADNLKEVK